MIYKRYNPSKENSHIIECYWTIQSSDAAEKIEKIIPDGFTEIIFHYGDPYCIKFKDTWQLQQKQLLAGQIKKYFFLKNTGTSGILGIKFKPAALTELFSLQMSDYTDDVADLHHVFEHELTEVEKVTYSNCPDEIKIAQIDSLFKSMPVQRNPQIEDCIQMIFDCNGLVAINKLASQLFITERQLERLFKKYIGLSPKFFTRIVRFNYIFSLMQSKATNWTDIALESGYYDSSHFIKNFKAFSGVDPSGYFFEEKTMANFFLQKSQQ